ncbi:hypothetical protein JW721_01930 [Candidatus Micrarchaeota archaeon]|nr:hypothetical protein [Candidatus Micrarchaeota archaeon]
MGAGTQDMGIIAMQIWERFLELLSAPANEPQMLWFAIPLVFATIMMTLYFGRYRKEELGWSTAFENTMIFLFVSFDLVRKMYNSTVPGSWDNILGSSLYLPITAGLALVSIVSMLFVYYHLLPKRLAYIAFSKLPINIGIYVVMTIVYVGVAADWITVGAGILLFAVVWLFIKVIQFLQRMSGKRLEEEEDSWENAGKREYVREEEDTKQASKVLKAVESETPDEPEANVLNGHIEKEKGAKKKGKKK